MKKSLQEVRQYFVNYGCELLEENYVNAHTKMRYRCVCGKESQINFNNFSNGKRCGCGRKELNRLTNEEIKSEVESRGFQFVSSKFVKDQHVICCVCKCGKQRKCRLKNLRRSGCKSCKDSAMKNSFQEVKNFFLQHKCEVIDEVYLNARTPLKYKCVCGNESKICFDSFKRGNRCQKCGNKKISEKVSGPNHPNWNPDREKAKQNLIFRKKCCGLLKHTLQCVGRTKNNKTKNLLGYDSKQLQAHIISHPNWPAASKEKWHIDHVFPIKAFLDHGILDIKLINCLENLQPMSQKENLTKHAKYDKISFCKWLQQRKEGQQQ